MKKTILALIALLFIAASLHANVRGLIPLDETVTPGKIDATNSPANEDILVTDGTNFTWSNTATLNGQLTTELIKAIDGDGLSIQDDAGNLGVFVEDGGNVGVGTSNPAEQLHVDGNLKITNAGQDSTISAEDASGNTDIFLNTGSDSYIFNDFLVGQVSAYQDVALDVSGNITHSDPKFLDEFWGFLNGSWTLDDSTGSTSFPSKAGGWVRLTTGATSGNARSYDQNDVCMFVNTKRPSFKIQVDLEQTTNLECAVGLTETGAGWGNDYIKVYTSNTTGNDWTLEVSNGGSTSSDTGQAATTSETTIKVLFTSDTALEWYIDGVSQGTIATNVPTVALQLKFYVDTEEASAHYVDFDYFEVLPMRH
jgi:hypothetical protein